MEITMKLRHNATRSAEGAQATRSVVSISY
nr:MAG TPA: hypothetical protein [Inoviridae sp.]